MLSLILSSQLAFFTLVLSSSALGLSILSKAVKKHGFFSAASYPYQALKKRFNAYRFLIDAPRMIQDGYDKAHGGPFRVDGPDIHYHFVADAQLIKEIDHAPRDVLSLQAAAKTLLQPEFSMHRFNWSEERGFDGTPLVRTLRSLLRNNLGSLLPKTRVVNAAIIDDLLNRPGKQPHITTIARACVARTNARAFFGEQFSENESFMKAAEDFVDKTIFIAEAVRLLPGFVGISLGRFLEYHFSSQHIMYNALVPVAQQRIDEQELRRCGHAVPEHKDCMQWIMEQSSRLRPWTAEVTAPWTAKRIVHELMALWFGAVHSMGMATTFAIRDICLHPEYVEPLRKEMESSAYEAWETTGNGLPLLDSFLKESARVNPLDNLSTRRKVLKPFTLSNGVHVDRGDWLATPLTPMLRDPKNWVDPLEFQGFRHLSTKILMTLDSPPLDFRSLEPGKAAPLTDTRGWQTWGTGRMACPGRFYASAGIKQIFSLILLNYDCEILDACSARKFSWRTCNVPRSDMPIVIRPRASLT